MPSVTKENRRAGLLLLGLNNNIFKNIIIHVTWVLNPNSVVTLATKLQSEVNKHPLLSAIAIGYINEFFSKYIIWGKSKKDAFSIIEHIDTHNTASDKTIDAIIKLRKIRLAIKRETKKIGVPENEITKNKPVGVSGGVVEGSILNIKNENQNIPIGTIGIFPNAGTMYTNLFKECVGIIFLKGGITSHGAIIAREFGIPTIVYPNIKMSDGDRVILDGTNGKITIETTDI